MISASTRFLAQPKEMSPTLIGDGFEALLITITGQEGMRATPGWQIKRNNGDSRCPGRASCGTEKSDEIRQILQHRPASADALNRPGSVPGENQRLVVLGQDQFIVLDFS